MLVTFQLWALNISAEPVVVEGQRPTPTGGCGNFQCNGGDGGNSHRPQSDPYGADRLPEDYPEGVPVEVADLGKINTCSNDPRVTETSRGTVSTDDDLMRKTAANQMLQATVPNVVNTRTGRSNQLRITVEWSDGGAETFEHTSMAGWVSKGLTKTGDGKPGSACMAAG
jgi:hypothetical protein